ncbi:unnamed protein product [Ilex paraguariensis]|uniref:Uncharacterized protein n=1 Tax=Ilex paraguariensis TaxID=185542 RepID=A0ABC8R4T1_9AQUA
MTKMLGSANTLGDIGIAMVTFEIGDLGYDKTDRSLGDASGFSSDAAAGSSGGTMGNLGNFSLYMMSENRATIGDVEAQARGVDAQAVGDAEWERGPR